MKHSAPGHKAINTSHHGPFKKGAKVHGKDATKRREPRGGYGSGTPSDNNLLRRGRRNTAFDAGGNMAGGKRIPWSRTQRTA